MVQKFWPLFVLIAVGVLVIVVTNPFGPPPEPPPTELQSIDVVVGDGTEAKKGDNVEVHYTGKLFSNGDTFDSSRGRGTFKFALGAGNVIEGWDRGVAGMKEGGKRKLVIPAKLGYGERGSPPKIPANAALVFDVELIKVSAAPKLEITDVTVGQGKEAKTGDTVEVHYTGKLASIGQQFDSSRGKEPFTFKIGTGSVIQGWDAGIPGMKEGGQRRLHIPAHMGYGATGSPPAIPANADLIFDVELLRVR